MTLNSVIAFILRYSPSSIALEADYVTVVEDKPIMFANIVFQLYLAKTVPRLHAAVARSLCDS